MADASRFRLTLRFLKLRPSLMDEDGAGDSDPVEACWLLLSLGILTNFLKNSSNRRVAHFDHGHLLHSFTIFFFEKENINNKM